MLKNRETDYRTLADVSVVIENETTSSISAFKRKALRNCGSETIAAVITQQHDNDEDETPVDALQSLYISQKDEDNN